MSLLSNSCKGRQVWKCLEKLHRFCQVILSWCTNLVKAAWYTYFKCGYFQAGVHTLYVDIFRLVYRAGNICNHFFTRDFLQVRITQNLKKQNISYLITVKNLFLQRVCEEHEKQLPHHVAKKKIPFTDLATGNAVK